VTSILEFKSVAKTFGDVKALVPQTTRFAAVVVLEPFDRAKRAIPTTIHIAKIAVSTILKLLMAEYKPTSGSIVFDGTDIVKIKKSDIPYLRRKIGAVFQDFKLLKERSIRENIEMALAVVGVDNTQWGQRVDQVLKMVGLSHRAELFPLQLSGGELQRVAIARALVVNPLVIFADEPTGNLDWEIAGTIMDLLAKINKEGKTVIVTSHNKEIIDRMKKRVIHLKDGKVAG